MSLFFRVPLLYPAGDTEKPLTLCYVLLPTEDLDNTTMGQNWAEKVIRSLLFIVDRADFLLDTWRKSERQAFYRMIEKQWNSFITNMGATLVFCLQTSDEIEALKIRDPRGDSRVHRLYEFNELV